MAAVNFIKTHLRARSVSPSARHPASIWNMISRTFPYLTQAFIVFASSAWSLMRAHGANGRRVQTFLFHGYTIERMQESPANVADALRSFCTDEKRLLKKWWKFAVDQVKKPESGHFDLISSYVESLENGSPSPVTGEDGRNAIRLLECIEESLKERRPVNYSAW